MRIALTGGAGYVGSVMTRMLLEAGHEVRVLDSLRKGGTGILPLFADQRLEFAKVGQTALFAVYDLAAPIARSDGAIVAHAGIEP